MGMDVKNKYNFGVVGQAGSGKSSVVNAVRGVQDNDEKLGARVGEVETTMKPTAYPHPNYPHVVMWDLPGAGTINHPSETYFTDKTLYAFDCLIIVTDTRFKEVDLQIAKQASEWGVPVVFLRNKANQDIEAKRRRSRKSIEEVKQEFREEVSKDIIPQLANYHLPDRSLYIISAWAFLDDTVVKMDEGRLLVDVISMAINRRRVP